MGQEGFVFLMKISFIKSHAFSVRLFHYNPENVVQVLIQTFCFLITFRIDGVCVAFSQHTRNQIKQSGLNY